MTSEKVRLPRTCHRVTKKSLRRCFRIILSRKTQRPILSNSSYYACYFAHFHLQQFFISFLGAIRPLSVWPWCDGVL